MNRAQPINSLPTGPCHFQSHHHFPFFAITPSHLLVTGPMLLNVAFAFLPSMEMESISTASHIKKRNRTTRNPEKPRSGFFSSLGTFSPSGGEGFTVDPLATELWHVGDWHAGGSLPARPDLPTRSEREIQLLTSEGTSRAVRRSTQVDIKGTPLTMGRLRRLNHGRISQCVSSSSVFSSPPSPSAALLAVRALAARAARPAASDFMRVVSGRPRLRRRRSSRFALATS